MNKFRSACCSINEALIFVGIMSSVTMFPFLLGRDWPGLKILFLIVFLMGLVMLALGIWGRDYKEEVARYRAAEAISANQLEFYQSNMEFCAKVALDIGSHPPGSAPAGSHTIAFFQEMREVLDKVNRDWGRPPLGQGLWPGVPFDETARIADEITQCPEGDPQLNALYARLYQSVAGELPDWWTGSDSL